MQALESVLLYGVAAMLTMTSRLKKSRRNVTMTVDCRGVIGTDLGVKG